MNVKGNNLPVWMITNAWREIFARIFEGIESQINISPEWLVNPVTNRRLKLDMLYPEIGVAVRFEGVPGKQRRRRPSLEEEAQQRTRDQARVDMCLAHNVFLIVVDSVQSEPRNVFQQIDTMLSRAGQRVNCSELLQKIKEARVTATTLARQVRRVSDLKLYADLWEDRQYQMLEPAQSPAPAGQTISYTSGMAVEHTIFGSGVVLSTTPSNDDILVTVDFVAVGRKTLAASLVGDKLFPR